MTSSVSQPTWLLIFPSRSRAQSCPVAVWKLSSSFFQLVPAGPQCLRESLHSSSWPPRLHVRSSLHLHPFIALTAFPAILFHISFFVPFFISRGRHILVKANKSGLLSTSMPRQCVRPLLCCLSSWFGILTQLSKQEEERRRHQWCLPTVNTRCTTVCVCGGVGGGGVGSQLGSDGVHYASVTI